MDMKGITAILLSLLALVGCGGAATREAAPPALSGQSALDAQATLAVWSAQETAVAEETRRAVQATADTAAAWAEGTRVAENATAGAIQAAQATSSAYGTAVALEATTTAGAQHVAATAQAVSATATWDALLARGAALAIEATATADAAALRFQEEQAAKALAARQAEIERAMLWTRMTPWIVGTSVTAVLVALLALVGVWVIERMRRMRPVQAGDVWVMVGPGGPTVLNRPPAQIPATLPRAPVVTVEPEPETPIPLPLPTQGHVLIAGPTGAGKSTAMRAILQARENVVVLDPHSTNKDWGRATVLGSGRDYRAIGEYMEGMQALLTERYQERSQGVTAFSPRTVAIDEMPSIVDELGRDIASIWRQWLREGRKVGLFLVVSTQSLRVKTLGIEGEGDLLANFALSLALGPLAQQEYGRLVAGMDWPAVALSRGRARPVIIPADAGVVVEGGVDARPLFVAPAPRVKADPRRMTADDRAHVRELLARGWSQRAIEEEMFGYTGGAAWRAVQAVRDGEDALTPAYYEMPAGATGSVAGNSTAS